MTYRGECVCCGVEVFTGVGRVGDVEVGAMLAHLWAAHPDVVRRPDVLPLADLLRHVHVRMA